MVAPAMANRRRARAIVRPACLGSVLLAMYAIFVYLILVTFEDEGRGKDSGAAHHLGNWLGGKGATTMTTRRGGAAEEESPSERGAGGTSGTSSSSSKNDTGRQRSGGKSSGVDDPDLVHFCGECMWKDTLISCDDRVAWEVDKGRSSTPAESMQANLIYCQRPHELHVSDYCGSCQWKDTVYSCDERVTYEVGQKGLSEIEAKKRNLAHCRLPPYVPSPLCGGCVRALTNMTSKMFREGVPCWDLVLRWIKQGKFNATVTAARAVAEEFPEYCGLCHPETCWRGYFGKMSVSARGLGVAEGEFERGFRTKFWRFDRAAPEIANPTTLVLPSIPDELRIPPSRFVDIEAFLTEKYEEFESSNETSHVPIFIEYNPGLTPIPPSMKKYLPKYAAYAVALRVTPANNCFKREQMADMPQKVWDHTMMSATNLLGIALLDEDYEMLPGYDVIVDIATQLGFQRDGYGTTYFGEPTFMDYRLFTLNDAIYLHANADITVVTKLELRMKRYSRTTANEEFILDNVYGGDRLQVTMLHQFNTIWSGGERGKNYALFSVPNATDPSAPDSVYAEVEINPYHQVQQIYLDDIEMLKRNIIKKRIRRNYSVDKIMMRKVKNNGNLTDSEIEPDPSYFTVDELWFPGSRPAFRRAGHGGACCVSLSREEVLAQGEHIFLTHNSWGENDYLLVGVAHTSVIWKPWYRDKSVPDDAKAMIPHTHYVSFFYAFEPHPPFNLRARSGYFCLGFAGEDGTEGGMFNPHSVLTINRKLSQHNETFSCPQIHFVSSFVEKVGDPSKTVIGYGINDCTPRLVEVSKKEISRMLFSDPWEMKIEREMSDFDRAQSESMMDSSPKW